MRLLDARVAVALAALCVGGCEQKSSGLEKVLVGEWISGPQQIEMMGTYIVWLKFDEDKTMQFELRGINGGRRESESESGTYRIRGTKLYLSGVSDSMDREYLVAVSGGSRDKIVLTAVDAENTRPLPLTRQKE